MIQGFTSAGLVVLMWFMGSGAAHASCPARVGTPTVVVTTADAGVVYHTDATTSELLAAASSGGGSVASASLRGLTVVKLESRMSVTNAYMSSGDTLCVYPSRVEVFIGYQSPQNVYILGKYGPGSCQYDVIRAHENGHVRINVDTLKALVPQLKAGLEKAVSNPGYPVSAPSREWAQEAIRNSLSGLLRAYVEAHIQQRSSLNAMLDTPENYAATSRMCSSW